MKFSVLISVYEKEEPLFFEQSLRSILIDQTIRPNELVIVKDGPLTMELEKVINTYVDSFSNIIKVVNIPENKGLGEALRIGITHCSNELIARMDSDDISTKFRFERQLDFMKRNPNISVVGSYISEFYDSPQDTKFTRVTPKMHEDIKTMLKRRNPMNHVTVMFRKADLEKVGGYKHLLYLEDYYLWARFIGNGFKLYNIQESLVLVRTGENMYKRRSNPEYIQSWKLLQDEMFSMNLINRLDYIKNMINIIGFVYLPAGMKEKVYKFLLRKKVG